MPELRSRTKQTRYRLPDVSVVLQPPGSRFLLVAAHIAIEILSEDDRMSQVLEKLAEYQAAGVGNIWLIDPRLELLSIYSTGSVTSVDALSTPDGIELTRDEVFAGKG